MNKLQGIEFKRRPALQECWRHQTRLHAAWQEAINFIAVKYLAIQTLNDAEVSTLDQPVFRFGGLHDVIGPRLLPAGMRPPEKSQENGSFLYKLSTVENRYFARGAGSLVRRFAQPNRRQASNGIYERWCHVALPTIFKQRFSHSVDSVNAQP
ncbi:MAG: hypothetical protein BVN35_05710 [Proteobacteria bacterium ST_bin11]|nr:MAG: hypothetical protein BVN35_05710 [Proteobacteria bacterium ST_bin11]